MSIRLIGYASYSRLNWILSCTPTFNLKRSRDGEFHDCDHSAEKSFRTNWRIGVKKNAIYVRKLDRPRGAHSELVRDTFPAVVKFANELIHELTANRYASIYARIVARIFRACCFSCSPLRIYEHLMCVAKKYDDALAFRIRKQRISQNIEYFCVSFV